MNENPRDPYAHIASRTPADLEKESGVSFDFCPPFDSGDNSEVAAQLNDLLHRSQELSLHRLSQITAGHKETLQSPEYRATLVPRAAGADIKDSGVLSYGAHGREKDAARAKRSSNASINRFFGVYKGNPGAEEKQAEGGGGEGGANASVGDMHKKKVLSAAALKRLEEKRKLDEVRAQLRKEDPTRTSPAADSGYKGQPVPMKDPDEPLKSMALPEPIEESPPTTEELLQRRPEVLFRFKGYEWQRGKLTEPSKRKLGFYWLHFSSDGMQYECNLPPRRYANLQVNGGWAIPIEQPPGVMAAIQKSKHAGVSQKGAVSSSSSASAVAAVAVAAGGACSASSSSKRKLKSTESTAADSKSNGPTKRAKNGIMAEKQLTHAAHVKNGMIGGMRTVGKAAVGVEAKHCGNGLKIAKHSAGKAQNSMTSVAPNLTKSKKTPAVTRTKTAGKGKPSVSSKSR